jgi:asparagine synthase (glutamine-hydrolysing)
MSYKSELCRVLYSTVHNSIKDVDKVAIAFSGGVDSTLLSKICKDLRIKTFMITVGFPHSHDVLFSKRISNLISEPQNHIIYELNDIDCIKTLQYVKSKIACNNLSHIENCIAFYYLSRIVKENDLGEFFLTANGLDELFCGYDKYRLYFDKGYNFIIKYMEEKLFNEFHLMNEVSNIIEQGGIKTIQPFMTDNFISFAKMIPLEYKIKGIDDFIRKHIIREIALKVGVPKESAMYPKKALQYGSLIHKHCIRQYKKFI